MHSYQTELIETVQQSRWYRVILAVCAIVQGVAVYCGLSGLMIGDGLAATAIPIVTAFAVTIMMYVFWDYVCSVFPLLHSPVRRAMAVGFAVLMGLVTIGISSWFIASAIGGDQATIRHQQDYTKAATKQFDIALHNVANEEELGRRALDIAAAWHENSEREGKYGSQCGKGAGFGDCAQMLANAAAGFSRLAQTVEDKRSEAKELHKQATDLVAEMGQNIEQSLFIQKAAKLKQLLVKLDGTTAASAAGIGGIVNFQSNTAGEVLRVEAEKNTKEVRGLARAITEKREKVSLDPYVPMSSAIAVIRYASAAPGGWVVGVALDLVPMILCLILMMLHSEARDPHQHRRPFQQSGEVTPLRRPAE